MKVRLQLFTQTSGRTRHSVEHNSNVSKPEGRCTRGDQLTDKGHKNLSNADFKEEENLTVSRLVGDPTGEASPATQPTRLLGQHYELISPLGEGGMSKVYKARHTILGELVAVKILRSNLCDDERTLRRFREEALAATKLKHPNICSVREFGIDNGSPYLVMDLIEGQSLDDLISNKGKLHPQHALKLFASVCEGLGYAHDKDIIHRDIKPANLILSTTKDGSEVVQLVDFGIAKLVREDDTGPNLTRTGEVFGTPNYMSPEQCLGRPVDQRSDIYSLGCVLFHLVAGTPPLSANSVLETLNRQVNDSPEILKDVPAGINSIIQKCMQKVPANRYESIGLLKEDIVRVLKGEKPDAHSVMRNARAGSRTGRVLFGLSLVLSIVVLTCTNALQTVRNSGQPIISTSLTLDSPWYRKFQEGKVAQQAGDSEKALGLFQEAYELARKGGAGAPDLAFLCEETADCARYLSEDNRAIKFFELAANHAKSIGDLDRYQKDLGGLARSEQSAKKYVDAIKHIDEILKVQQKITGDNPVIMAYWEKAGEARMNAGRPREAETYFQTVLKLSARYPGEEQKTVALASWNLGLIAEKTGNRQLAKNYYDQAVKTGRSVWMEEDQLRQLEEAKIRVSK